MRKSRYTDEQIIGSIRQDEPVWALRTSAARKASAAPRSTSGERIGEMEASDAKRLRELEAENTRLKKLPPPPPLAEAALDNDALKVAFGVKR